MNKENLIQAVKGEIDYCETTKIPLNPSYVNTEMARLDLINKYMLSQFRDSNTDSFGSQMVFYNIVSLPVEVASKMLDFDTKDVKLIAEGGNYWATWLMEKELGFWMEDKVFGRILNSFSYKLPKDGHIIAKKVGDDVILVPLTNMRFRPDALKLEETPLIEKHEYEYDQFKSEAIKRGWSNWRLVSKKTDSTQYGELIKSGNKITVFEAWFPEGYLEMEDNWFLLSYDGILLASGVKSKCPYKGLPWEKLDNRLLGRGQVEKLFNEQIYLNRIGNYKAEALHWSSKQLFQTRDASINSNLLGFSENGDTFIVNDEIKKVPVEERNLSFYNYEEGRWENHSNQRTFANEPVSGQRAPSGTPFSSTMLQAQMAQGYYDQKKEELGMFVKEILWDWVFPEFKKDKKKAHNVMMSNLMSSGQGSEKYFNMHLNAMINKEKMYKTMSAQTEQIRRAFMAERLKGKKVSVPNGAYDNLKYKMKIVMDNENIDVAGKLQTLDRLLQTLGSNPAVFQNKVTRDILFKVLNLSGFNPGDFEFQDSTQSLEEAGATTKLMPGGSMAKQKSSSVPQQTTSNMQV